ncbi:MAG TPA: hypothetical protein VJ912_01445 [Candidatus Nanoarchaeia archaeon]|nr:hypothetical protein [Candidatus Nanoarchaeia archaeon]
MGTCWNCETELSLQENQTKCDNCGQVVYYKCNACKEEFLVEDKESKKKLEECKLCGFFKCPHCGTCYDGCKKFSWQKQILKILSQKIPLGQYPELPQLAKQITDYLENEKTSIERKNCPERNVPISYAKGRIKSLLAKFEDYRVKDSEDREAFLKRINELKRLSLGETATISTFRETGSYGQEYRDAFNLLVCLGKFEIKQEKKKDSDETYDLFVRCDKEPCPYLIKENLVISYCPKCKKIYSKEKKYCDNCPPKTKGKNKGQLWELKKRLNNKDTCQMYRGYFK